MSRSHTTQCQIHKKTFGRHIFDFLKNSFRAYKRIEVICYDLKISHQSLCQKEKFTKINIKVHEYDFPVQPNKIDI